MAKLLGLFPQILARVGDQLLLAARGRDKGGHNRAAGDADKPEQQRVALEPIDQPPARTGSPFEIFSGAFDYRAAAVADRAQRAARGTHGLVDPAVARIAVLGIDRRLAGASDDALDPLVGGLGIPPRARRGMCGGAAGARQNALEQPGVLGDEPGDAEADQRHRQRVDAKPAAPSGGAGSIGMQGLGDHGRCLCDEMIGGELDRQRVEGKPEIDPNQGDLGFEFIDRERCRSGAISGPPRSWPYPHAAKPRSAAARARLDLAIACPDRAARRRPAPPRAR